jgi:hypothetical protein
MRCRRRAIPWNTLRASGGGLQPLFGNQRWLDSTAVAPSRVCVMKSMAQHCARSSLAPQQHAALHAAAATRASHQPPTSSTQRRAYTTPALATREKRTLTSLGRRCAAHRNTQSSDAFICGHVLMVHSSISRTIRSRDSSMVTCLPSHSSHAHPLERASFAVYRPRSRRLKPQHHKRREHCMRTTHSSEWACALNRSRGLHCGG